MCVLFLLLQSFCQKRHLIISRTFTTAHTFLCDVFAFALVLTLRLTPPSLFLVHDEGAEERGDLVVDLDDKPPVIIDWHFDALDCLSSTFCHYVYHLGSWFTVAKAQKGPKCY